MLIPFVLAIRFSFRTFGVVSLNQVWQFLYRKVSVTTLFYRKASRPKFCHCALRQFTKNLAWTSEKRINYWAVFIKLLLDRGKYPLSWLKSSSRLWSIWTIAYNGISKYANSVTKQFIWFCAFPNQFFPSKIEIFPNLQRLFIVFLIPTARITLRSFYFPFFRGKRIIKPVPWSHPKALWISHNL
jgi:hypothetical protein